MQLDLNPTFGAIFIGLLISVAFFGVNTLQVILYFLFFPKDKNYIKVLVVFVWLLDASQVILTGHSLYSYLILNFGNAPALVYVNLGLLAQVAVTSLITFVVQCFFANRVWRFGKIGRVCCILIIFLAFATIGLGLAFTGLSVIVADFSRVQEYRPVVIMHITAAVLCDFLITGSQVYLLRSHRTGHKRTNRLINQVLVVVIHQGLLTSTIALLELFLFLALPKTFWYIAIHCLISKSYTCSLLAQLNARRTLRKAAAAAMSQSPANNGIGYQPRLHNVPLVHMTDSLRHHLDSKTIHTLASDIAIRRSSGILGGERPESDVNYAGVLEISRKTVEHSNPVTSLPEDVV